MSRCVTQKARAGKFEQASNPSLLSRLENGASFAVNGNAGTFFESLKNTLRCILRNCRDEMPADQLSIHRAVAMRNSTKTGKAARK